MSPIFHILDPDGDVLLILTDHDEDSSKSDKTCVDDKNDTSHGEIRVRCSSKHLTLASLVFQAMLSQNFKESAVLRSTGSLKLPLPEDDPAALLILLNIIHGKTREIPLIVDLYMLTRIAILVDKYRLHLVVGILSRIWIDRLKVKMPQSWTEDLHRWIFISWVFQCRAEFKSATKIAERQSESRIDESKGLILPIPCSIVDAIDQFRQKALLGILTALRKAFEKYQGPDLTCTMRCDVLVLGSLTKTMKSMQVLTPLEAPYSKLSFSGLAQCVETMEILTDVACDRGYVSSCSNKLGGSIQVKEHIKDIIKKLEVELCGLELLRC